MAKKRLKFFRSLLKIILPIIYKILLKLKLNRRVINFLSEESYKSNNNHNFSNFIDNLLKDKKIIALDVGAQGGFNSDNFFSSRYNKFFEEILIEPIDNYTKYSIHIFYVIYQILWQNKKKKKINKKKNKI